MSSKIRVLIAGAGGGGYGVEVLKALRLSKKNYFIYCTDMSPSSLGLFLADKSSIVARAGSADYLKQLLKICHDMKIQAVIPGSDADLKAISQNEQLFKDRQIYLPINSAEVIDLCLNKVRTSEFLRSAGFNIPKFKIVKELKDTVSVKYYPVIVKPYIGGGGSNFTFIAQDSKELKFFCSYLRKYNIPTMIQQYIGGPDSEYTVGILSNAQKKIISTIGIRRFIQSGLSNRLKVPSRLKKDEMLVISSGISQGEIDVNPRILNEARRIAQALGSCGPLNIQGRYMKGKFYTFEINPRFSGTTYQRALAGINEPDLCIRQQVLGEKISGNIKPRRGRILRGLFEKFIPD